MAHQWRGLIAEYPDRLPFGEGDPVVTLREGGTPLVHAPALDARTGATVYVKGEGANPTGSFKDRGMTTAVSRVLQTGVKVVACASTGNTSASAAAYAVAAGLQSAVVLPAGKIAAGKLAQATETHPVALVNSVNPYRLQGQKTAAFEIVDQLGDAPDIHVLPVGNAGNITAYWMGYSEYAGRTTLASLDETATRLPAASTKLPEMWGVQAWGAAPLVLGEPVDEPETVATAIRIGNPASWKYAEAARDDSHGWIDRVTDERILAAQAVLAAEVGVFVEPASAASVAGLIQAAEAGRVPQGATIVCTVTGNGLKDTATALGGREVDIDPIAPTVEAAVAALAL